MVWSEFVLALAAFFLSHSIPVRPPIRAWALARLGRRGFTLVYSALSLGVLVWLVGAAGRAPFIPLWRWAPWQNQVALAVMLPVCLILALSIGRPNPFSFGGAHDERFDPAQPGIVGWMRHPLLVALGLWAGAHTLANGDLAHVIMFATFVAFAGLGGWLIDRRKRRQMGADWQRLRDAPREKRRPGPLMLLWQMPRRTALGIAAYIGLITLHPFLFGVNPIA